MGLDFFFLLTWILFKSVTYTPLVEDDGKILKCIYEQFDNEGNVLFEGNPKDQDEVELSVNFLEKTDPTMGPLERSAMVCS